MVETFHNIALMQVQMYAEHITVRIVSDQPGSR